MPARRSLALLVAVALVGVVVGSSVSHGSVQSPPRVFVSILPGGAGGSSVKMSLFSSRTGALSRRLASFSDPAWTNDGLALAPDGRSVYFTLIPRAPGHSFYLRLMRLDVTSRHQRFIAKGAQPALDKAGTQMAYAAFPRGLAVRDLSTGETRTIGLANKLGKAAELLNAAIGWLGNGSEIAIVPSAPAWDLMGPKPAPLHWCGTTSQHPVIVLVHAPHPPRPLSARCVHLGQAGLVALGGAVVLAPDPTAANSLLVAGTNRNHTTVERISQTGAVRSLVSIRDSLPVAFDSTGTHLMYLLGHNPPRLWEATLTGRHLTDRRRLPKRGWGSIAW